MMSERKQGRRSAEDAQQTKRDILKIAAELFCELGYERVSLRNISEKAGVSHSLIRHHFGSKEKIWRDISDDLHDFILRYIAVVYQNIPADYPSNVKLFEFAKRMLAYMITFKQPIQLVADAVRQEDALLDYFIDNSGNIEAFVGELVSTHNQDFPATQMCMPELKWQIIIYAHAAVSLTPFLTETWTDETKVLDECLLRHFLLFEDMLAAKLGIEASYRSTPKRVQDLIYDQDLQAT